MLYHLLYSVSNAPPECHGVTPASECSKYSLTPLVTVLPVQCNNLILHTLFPTDAEMQNERSHSRPSSALY